jgi:hypothetical protein
MNEIVAGMIINEIVLWCLTQLSIIFQLYGGGQFYIQHYCDKVCQGLAAGWWFSPDTPVSTINKTDRHHIAEILLRVVLNNQRGKCKNRYNKHLH